MVQRHESGVQTAGEHCPCWAESISCSQTVGVCVCIRACYFLPGLRTIADFRSMLFFYSEQSHLWFIAMHPTIFPLTLFFINSFTSVNISYHLLVSDSAASPQIDLCSLVSHITCKVNQKTARTQIQVKQCSSWGVEIGSTDLPILDCLHPVCDTESQQTNIIRF